MYVARPPLLELLLIGPEADSGDVIDQGIEPDVHRVARFVRERDPPREVAPRDADVAQAAIEPAEDLVAPDLGNAELRIVPIKILQLLLVLAEPEEVVLLVQALDRVRVRGVDRAAHARAVVPSVLVDEVGFLVEGFAAPAVQAFVLGEIDVVICDPAPDEFLDAYDVVRIDCADETVVRDVPEVGHLAELGSMFVDELPRRDALLFRGLLVARRVLIGAGQEEHLVAALTVETRQRVSTGELIAVMESRPVVDVRNGGRDVELHGDLLGILGRHAPRRPPLSRAAVAILTRLLLVVFTFVLIVVLAQIALVAARTRFDHAPIADILQQAWEGTQDYFSSLFQGSLGEATSTSILGGQRRSMGQVLLDAYPKSMLLVGLAVTLATVLGVIVGVVAAATRSSRLRAVLVGSMTAVISTPSFLLAILLILLSAEMVRRYNVRLWPSFGFGIDDHLILPTLVLAARPFAQ